GAKKMSPGFGRGHQPGSRTRRGTNSCGRTSAERCAGCSRLSTWPRARRGGCHGPTGGAHEKASSNRPGAAFIIERLTRVVRPGRLETQRKDARAEALRYKRHHGESLRG